jgi:long-chain acyl-CoA synthetase
VFNKFREILGGRVRVMITGSAPIAKEVLAFLKIAFCCQIHEGYGQTECAAPASITWSKDPMVGHVGPPFPSCDIKLVDVPDMNYSSDDKDDHGNPMPRGEVCYRGYNCFKGYYKQPDLTKETIDSDGWIHTGDIGMFTPQGTLKIIDRKKNIFKLSQGEYVVPDKIESKIAQSAYIAQIFVYGDSLQSNLVAVIVPDRPVLEKWAAENAVTGEYKEVIKNEKVRELIKEEVGKKCKEANLHGFEKPTEFYLTEVAFTPENDILTPTFKLKRNEAKLYFLKEIKEMYKGAKLQGEA